ncbi:MAG: hypothetical protein WDZ51_11745 [Pirellulaceae bacterium]
MTRFPTTRLSFLCLVAVICSGCAFAGPRPGVTTFWSKLGIPQASYGLQGNLINRRGNFPGLEKKPPLLAIANPLNLESPNPAIKAAAEIKAEEDLSRQKVKALKYLGTLGCGCYDKEGKVEAAFLAGLDDCNEDVRKAAVEAIQEVTGGVCDGGCNNNCCTKAIQERLQDMAYGETEGCWHEPSAEIRQMAMAALTACPPIEVPAETIPQREVAPGRETAPLPPSEAVPPPAPANPTAPISPPAPPAPVETSTMINPELDEVYANFYGMGEVGFVSHVPEANPSQDQNKAAHARVAISDEPHASVEATGKSQASPKLLGKVVIEYLDAREGIATMHRPTDSEVKVGELLNARIHSRTGDHSIEGQLEVVGVSSSLIKVKPVGDLAANTLRTGGHVTLTR